MTAAKQLDKFERKNGTILLDDHGTHFVVTTAQRIRADLVWATESVRLTKDDAIKEFKKHKECILARGHCVGDNTYLTR